MRKLLCIASLIFLPNVAFACKLGAEATDLEAFLGAKNDSQVIFLGKVTLVQELPRTASEINRDITIETSKWWRGAPQGVVRVFGAEGTMAETDCAGLFDFFARVGEQWLVVGTWWNGQIHPSGLLSVRLKKNGKLPAKIKAQLNRISKK